MRILGIDPGSITTGYGIIACEGSQLRYIASGCIKIGRQTWSERLKNIFDDLTKIFLEYMPNCCAIEQVFVHKNPASALKLGQARGAALVAAAKQNVTIAEYAPRAIKQAVVGYGGAEKSQIQQMVRALLQLNTVPPHDAADALAIAICHASHARLNYRSKI